MTWSVFSRKQLAGRVIFGIIALYDYFESNISLAFRKDEGMSVYITGDTHGDIDIEKLNKEYFPEQETMTKDDYLIIAGDFGGVWSGGEKDDALLDWYESRRYTTLFIDGNHENHELLASYPEYEWNGGKVHYIRPSVIHLMRGQVYDICGLRFFTMGGAFSVDKEYRVPGKSWWPEEMPSREEYEEAEKNLKAACWEVDYVVTHCCAYEILLKLVDIVPFKMRMDEENQFFSRIEKKLKYEHWFCGHYHIDHAPDKKHTILYQDILRII